MLGIPMGRGGLPFGDFATPKIWNQVGASGIGQFGEAADLKMQTAEVEKFKVMAAKGETCRNSIHDMTVMNTVLWGM